MTNSVADRVVNLDKDSVSDDEFIDIDNSGDVEKELSNAQVKQAVENLPEKFKGKEMKDVVSMYENLEKELGRKGQEVGDLRKLTDKLLQADFVPKDTPKETRELEPETDFFDDPEKAVTKILEKQLAPLNERLNKSTEKDFFNELEKEYSGFEATVQSPEFIDWVGKSNYRIKMFKDADSYDLDAARELLETWTMLHPKKEEEDNKDSKEDRDKTLSAASTEKGSTGTSRKKVFRRSDLIRLKMNDPQKYASLEPEIMKAYQEGRVK